MKIIFSAHAKMRFEQRAKMNIKAGYSFVRQAEYPTNDTQNAYINKYRIKNEKLDPSVSIIVYHHWMFVVRIEKNRIFVITVLVVH